MSALTLVRELPADLNSPVRPEATACWARDGQPGSPEGRAFTWEEEIRFRSRAVPVRSVPALDARKFSFGFVHGPW